MNIGTKTKTGIYVINKCPRYDPSETPEERLIMTLKTLQPYNLRSTNHMFPANGGASA